MIGTDLDPPVFVGAGGLPSNAWKGEVVRGRRHSSENSPRVRRSGARISAFSRVKGVIWGRGVSSSALIWTEGSWRWADSWGTMPGWLSVMWGLSEVRCWLAAGR